MKRWIVFFEAGGSELLRISVRGLGEGEIESTIGLLAYEKGIPESSIYFAEMGGR